MKIICRSWNDVSHGNGDQIPSEVAYEDDPPGKSPRKCRKQRITTIIAYLINAIVIGTAYHSLGPIIQRTQYTLATSSNVTTAHLKSTQTCATFHLNSTASVNLPEKFSINTKKCPFRIQKNGHTQQQTATSSKDFQTPTANVGPLNHPIYKAAKTSSNNASKITSVVCLFHSTRIGHPPQNPNNYTTIHKANIAYSQPGCTRNKNYRKVQHCPPRQADVSDALICSNALNVNVMHAAQIQPSRTHNSNYSIYNYANTFQQSAIQQCPHNSPAEKQSELDELIRNNTSKPDLMLRIRQWRASVAQDAADDRNP